MTATEPTRTVRAEEAPKPAAVVPTATRQQGAATAPLTHAVAATNTTPARLARPGERTHAVQAGESLWSIASDVLGADASPAQVAREVHRLWTLNRDRIGTGNPDLLMVGTRLVLR
jgi:Tfp pilus assembly protein FimV